ncbi:hypothetical protein PXD04_10360 [Methanosphaera sp. ISO3-F5]|uniref:hypothetical protein n=1 Tax=Methanosphaera sp. ISO3-F5 TaxID=1452353 RepID=UPI002B2578FD|nr:hypothetical protein [Methanosphaera sp. ISO3-F5]WQH64093.1 hypothetical protein PXD04_10360 [Methanosphaera sp. ISO3-F5]
MMIRSYFRMVDCGLCANSGVNVTPCKFCDNREGNIMWHISDEYAMQLTDELIKIVQSKEETVN